MADLGSSISVVEGTEITGASPRFMFVHRASTSIVAPSALASGFFFSFSLSAPRQLSSCLDNGTANDRESVDSLTRPLSYFVSSRNRPLPRCPHPRAGPFAFSSSLS